MRVLYVLNVFPKLSETFILREILQMQEFGMDVRVLAWSAPEGAVHPEAKRVRHLRYFEKPGLARAAAAHLYWLLRAPSRYWRALRMSWDPRNELRRLFAFHLDDVRRIAAARPDVMHAHFGLGAANLAMLAHILTGVPYTFTTHRGEIFDTPARNFALKSTLARRHITISEFNRRALIERFGVPAESISVVHCGVECEAATSPLPIASQSNRAGAPRFARRTSAEGVNCEIHDEQRATGTGRRATGSNGRAGKPGPPEILSVGRLERQKGMDVLIEACARLHAQGCRFVCRIIGEGQERASLEALVKRLGLNGRVVFEGALTADKVRRKLEESSVAVLASRSEGIPVFLMEAMAARVPVVSTRITGIPELVEHGKSGYLAEAEDADELAGYVRRLLEDPSLASAFAEEGYAKVCREFNLASEAAKLAALWKGDAVAAGPAETRLQPEEALR